MRLVLLLLAACALSADDDSSVARDVYERLTSRAADLRTPPALLVRSEGQRLKDPPGNRIAWFDPAASTITIDQRTLSLCSFHADCVAVFLSHELEHFYLNHHWGGDFGSRMRTTAVGRAVAAESTLDAQRLLFEAQADEAGGLLGYLAGYDTLGKAAMALDAVYKAYNLDADLAGYPSLADRKKIAAESAGRLRPLLPLFDAGSLLLMLGRYEDAGATFDYVASRFPEPAASNNAGIANLLAAADTFPPSAHVESYPWTLDGQSKLERLISSGAKGSTQEAPLDRQARLLRMAEARLNEALRRDPDYLPAAINLAFLKHLTGKKGTARELIADLSSRPSAASIKSVLDGAREITSQDTWDPAATLKRHSAIGGRITSAEAVGGVSFEKFPKALGNRITIGKADAVSIASVVTTAYRALEIRQGDWELRALLSPAGYRSNSAKGIHIGSGWSEVSTAYGAASYRQDLAQGRCEIFAADGIIFCGDPEKVNRWIAFETNQ